METLKKFMIVLNDADKYPLEHELAEAAQVAKDKLNRLVEQRDAALKLAQSWLEALYFLPPDSAGKPYIGTAYRKCARELRAIFAPKEGK